jgi:hypothetical protein
MRARIDVRYQDGVWADLRIVNDGNVPARIHNPGNYVPIEGWQSSREAYRIAVLLSFHFLDMTLRNTDGCALGQTGIATLADHIVGRPIELDPGSELHIPVPLHEFYDLEVDADYCLTLTYGDDDVRVSATASFSY